MVFLGRVGFLLCEVTFPRRCICNLSPKRTSPKLITVRLSAAFPSCVRETHGNRGGGGAVAGEEPGPGRWGTWCPPVGGKGPGPALPAEGPTCRGGGGPAEPGAGRGGAPRSVPGSGPAGSPSPPAPAARRRHFRPRRSLPGCSCGRRRRAERRPAARPAPARGRRRWRGCGRAAGAARAGGGRAAGRPGRGVLRRRRRPWAAGGGSAAPPPLPRRRRRGGGCPCPFPFPGKRFPRTPLRSSAAPGGAGRCLLSSPRRAATHPLLRAAAAVPRLAELQARRAAVAKGRPGRGSRCAGGMQGRCSLARGGERGAAVHSKLFLACAPLEFLSPLTLGFFYIFKIKTVSWFRLG